MSNQMDDLIINSYKVARQEGKEHQDAVKYVLRVVLGINEEYGSWDSWLMTLNRLVENE